MKRSQLAYDNLVQVINLIRDWEKRIDDLEKELYHTHQAITNDATSILSYQNQLSEKEDEISFLISLLSEDQLGQFQKYLEQNNNK